MRTNRGVFGIMLFWLSVGFGFGADEPALAESLKEATGVGQGQYEDGIQPMLERYCYGCHGMGKTKGGLALDQWKGDGDAVRARAVWEKVLHQMRMREMPPEGKPQPSDGERAMLVEWIERAVFKCDCENPDPGRVTIRRLNRAEYNNTIRDLVGIDFKPADDFPSDDVGYGFDNIGDVLSLPPILLEKYLAAAEEILDRAIVWDPGRYVILGDPHARDAEWDLLYDGLEMVKAVKRSDLPESHRRIFALDSADKTAREDARRIIERFARRAFRRPLEGWELDRLVKLDDMASENGETFERSVGVVLEAVLISPHFLFRGEVGVVEEQSGSRQPIDEFALASRLSYFLWSSMPDDELFGLAERQLLRANLDAQVRRMLADRKARALIENFGMQWLQIRNLTVLAPDRALFPEFDEGLRLAMGKETEEFFEFIVEENRSILEFLDADYTFVNERLAQHYGLAGVLGEGFQRVSLKGTERGGLLTQGSILAITSNPTRTSPVKRGKWILENILGSPPPPPPPDVPELSEDKAVVLSDTLRQRMEQHRANALCASCHARMDPIGFGFENFDAIGAWRQRDGNSLVDAAGTLVSGESFKGPAQLRQILLSSKRDEFVRCLTEKMLTYALGRGLEYYDKCALDEITKAAAKADYRFQSIVWGVVKSVPFQMRRSGGEF